MLELFAIRVFKPMISGMEKKNYMGAFFHMYFNQCFLTEFKKEDLLVQSLK